jgi:lipid-A-disaccharide synthase
MSAKRLYIIAGEASGDLHGGHLVHALKKINPDLIIRGTGGDHMLHAGVDIIRPISEMNFMGFVEVLKNIRPLLSILRQVKADIRQFKPDAVILIDYPGFNLKIAEYAHDLGIKVFYYISPQLWAWKKGRIATIKKSVDKMFVILPFETQFYKVEGIEAEFLGHPLMDVIDPYLSAAPPRELAGDKPVLALLPGSRKQEISRILPVFLEAAARLPEYEPVIACAPSVPDSVFLSVPGAQNVKRVQGDTYKLLHAASFAFVASGTATLETALFGVPQIVGYKADAASVFLARQFVKVKYISLVNLILDAPALTELIQEQLTADALIHTMQKMQKDENNLKKNYDALRQILGGAGCAQRTAQRMLESL